MELVENFVDAADLSSDVMSPEYQEECLLLRLDVLLSVM